MCDDFELYKPEPEAELCHATAPQQIDLLSQVLEQLDTFISQAAYDQSLDHWNILLKFLNKMNSKFILRSDLSDEEKEQRISALYNDDSSEKIISLARDGFPNLDSFIQRIIIQTLSLVSDYMKYPHLLFLKYNMLDDIVKILNDPSSKVIYSHVLNILSNCVNKTLLYREKRQNYEEPPNVNEYYSELLSKILEICWTKGEDNCYVFHHSDLMNTATALIKICKFDIAEAASLYDHFKARLISEKDSEDIYDLPNVIKAFRMFLKKEPSYYNNLMSDELYLILINLLNENNFVSTLKLMQPLFETTEFVDIFAKTDFIQKICEIIQTHPARPFALKVLSQMIMASSEAANIVRNTHLTSRPQLYQEPSIIQNEELRPGKANQEGKRGLLLVLMALQQHGIPPETDEEFAYIPTLLEETIQYDDHEMLGASLKIIHFIITRFNDFTIDIEDRLHEILSDEDFEEFYPIVEEIGSILYPEDD